MSTDFQTYLKTSAEEINSRMEDLFESWRTDVSKVDDRVLKLLEYAIEACRGGKRLRASLVKLGYEMAGGDPTNPAIIDAAVVFEIFQTAILAHDDIIDKSPTRRGKPTIYKALGGDHYAVSQTIILGDIGFFLALDILAKTSFPPELINKGLQSFNKTMLDTAFGEMLDIELPFGDRDKTLEDAIKIFKLKTSRYTLTGPLHLGAILAGADEEMLLKLERFGIDLGISFQICDDILGVFGDESTIGKSVTSDIEEGKHTFMSYFALQKGSPEQIKFLEENYGKGEVSSDVLEEIRQIFVDTGALSFAKKEALDYVEKAKKVIPEITSDVEYQKLLTEMAEFLVEREK